MDCVQNELYKTVERDRFKIKSRQMPKIEPWLLANKNIIYVVLGGQNDNRFYIYTKKRGKISETQVLKLNPSSVQGL